MPCSLCMNTLNGHFTLYLHMLRHCVSLVIIDTHFHKSGTLKKSIFKSKITLNKCIYNIKRRSSIGAAYVAVHQKVLDLCLKNSVYNISMESTKIMVLIMASQ